MPPITKDPTVPIPVEKTVPEIDPLREVTETVKADCLVRPDEYLEEVRVPIGGE